MHERQTQIPFPFPSPRQTPKKIQAQRTFKKIQAQQETSLRRQRDDQDRLTMCAYKAGRIAEEVMMPPMPDKDQVTTLENRVIDPHHPRNLLALILPLPQEAKSPRAATRPDSKPTSKRSSSCSTSSKTDEPPPPTSKPSSQATPGLVGRTLSLIKARK